MIISKWWKKSKLVLIITILNFFVLIISVINSLKFGKRLFDLILFNIPFILCLGIIVLEYVFNKFFLKKIYKFIKILLILLIPIYYIIISFILMINQCKNPKIDIKHYNKYYNNVDEIKTIFPKNIPKSAKKVIFEYYPGFASIKYNLYYVDSNIDIIDFDNLYSKQAEWIGYVDSYNFKEGFFTAGFDSILQKIDKKNFKIYLIDSFCHGSDYCNHGNYLLVAINENTKEVIYEYSDW